jgi:hypothetical protein
MIRSRKENIMTTIKALIKRHPVLTYYILVFAISWGGILIVVGPGGYPGTSEQVERLSLPVLLALFAGPSVSGLVMTGLVHGRAGLRDLRSRLFRRVGIRWYAVALLFAPLLVTVVLLVLLLFSPEFVPGIAATSDKVFLLLFGIGWGLIGGGLLEETGWTGFAVPELRRRYSAFTTGLIVGILWGIWHILVSFWMSGTASGDLSLAIFLPAMVFYMVSLPAYRVLLVWVYDRTGNLLVVMLMHAVFSTSRIILNPPALALVPGLHYDLALAIALWVVVAVTHSRQTLPQPAQGALPG